MWGKRFFRLMVVVSCLAAVEALAQGLLNPGFELDGEGWNLPARFCRLAPGEGRNGTTALIYENLEASLPMPRARAVQTLKLQPNQAYRLSCYIKGSIEQTDRWNIGASFAIHIMRGNDVINYIYVKGVAQTTDEWALVSKEFTFPDNADRCEVHVGLHNISTGVAYYDDFSLENLNEYFVYMTSPGMGVVFADDPVVRAGVYYSGPRMPDGLQVRLTVNNQIVNAAVKDAQVAFDLEKWPGDGSATGLLELFDTDGETLLASQTHPLHFREAAYRRRVANACWIDHRGRAIVDGKPFLPIGLFVGACPRGHIDTIADSDFNCVASYSAPNLRYGAKPNTPEEAIASIREVMDYLQARNLKMIFSLQHVFEVGKYAMKQWHGISGSDQIVEALVKGVKDHPALLSWYINDERPIAFLPRVKQRRELINRIDETHPSWSLSMLFTQMHHYAPTGDVLACDPYPIHSPKPRHMNGVDLAGNMTQRTKMPYWGVPQLYNSSFSAKKKSIKAEHDPTREEMEAMSLHLASYGATGFVFYHFWNIRNPAIPETGYFERRWDDVKAVASTLKKLEPWIMADAEPEVLPCEILAGKVRVVRFRDNQQRECVVVTSLGPGEGRATFKFDGKCRSENGQTKSDDQQIWTFAAEGITSDILWPQ